MPVDLTDPQILELVETPKPLPAAYPSVLARATERRKHKRSDLQVESTFGRFRIMLRQNILNALDFSAIFGYHMPSSSRVFRLRRYNGKHYHTNRIEQETISGFHIHRATERYQAIGAKEDAFAESTDRYSMLSDALNCLLEDCNFIPPEDGQSSLFLPRVVL